MTRRFPLILCATCVAMLAASEARADCTVEYTEIQFPAYDVFGTTPVDATGTIRYKCAPEQQNVTPLIRISLGEGPDKTFERRMTRSAETLRYNVFLDPQRTVVWGDGSRGTLAYTAACCAVFSTANLYGRIFPGQDVAAGSYHDTIVVTIEF